jgi:hypothetical protein
MDLYWEGTKWNEASSKWISTHNEKNKLTYYFIIIYLSAIGL